MDGVKVHAKGGLANDLEGQAAGDVVGEHLLAFLGREHADEILIGADNVLHIGARDGKRVGWRSGAKTRDLERRRPSALLYSLFKIPKGLQSRFTINLQRDGETS